MSVTSSALLEMLESSILQHDHTRKGLADVYFYLLLDTFEAKFLIYNQMYLERGPMSEAPNPSILIHPMKPFGPEVVFFVDIVKNGDQFGNRSKHKEADMRMRELFKSYHHRFTLPTIHAVCAFGLNICFYEYDVATGRVTPENVSPADFLNVMEEDEGYRKLQKVSKVVMQMSTTEPIQWYVPSSLNTLLFLTFLQNM
ncbi:hypothetical protein BDQ17DRAFT_1425679 [Cyathus striatus]|nr:hypothetical protein BDQ17DRAFT_1425679 [Cyathus striatus]